MDNRFGATELCFFCDAPLRASEYAAHLRSCLTIATATDPEAREEFHRHLVELRALAQRATEERPFPLSSQP